MLTVTVSPPGSTLFGLTNLSGQTIGVGVGVFVGGAGVLVGVGVNVGKGVLVGEEVVVGVRVMVAVFVTVAVSEGNGLAVGVKLLQLPGRKQEPDRGFEKLKPEPRSRRISSIKPGLIAPN